jgi:hypothetical protein
MRTSYFAALAALAALLVAAPQRARPAENVSAALEQATPPAPDAVPQPETSPGDQAVPPSSPPAQPPPAPESATPPPPPAQQAQPRAAAPAGQWVYTQQYGWVWMPYGDAYTYAPSDGYGQPYQYVYYPTFGWTWVVAPWVWGWGPWPYFGFYGPGYFAWYRWGWWRYPYWYHYSPAFRGPYPTFRGPGVPVRPRPAPAPGMRGGAPAPAPHAGTTARAGGGGHRR